MIAFGKTFAAGTLTFGSIASSLGGGMGWHDSQQMPYTQKDDNKDHQGKHTSYDDKEWKTGQKFYDLSWDKQQKLCSDDHYWNMWSQKVGYDDKMRDKLCAEHWGDSSSDDKQWDKDGLAWVKDDGHDSKDWSKDDWDKDRSQETAYHKSETAAQYYKAQSQEHEKQTVALEATSHQSDDSGKDHGEWGGWTGGDQKSVESSNYNLTAEHQTDAAASVEAAQIQTTVVNNYNYINGDNNTINNNITVANVAAAEQTATSSESTAVAIEAGQSSSDDQGWTGDTSSSDASLEYAATSEKSSSSSVTTASAYQLEESYGSQTNDEGTNHDEGWSEDDWNEDWKQDGWKQDEGNKADCPPVEQHSYRDDSSDCE